MPEGPNLRPMFRSLAIPASGLSAQRQRMEVTAANIANAETTSTPDGGPYRRRVVHLAPGTAPSAVPAPGGFRIEGPWRPEMPRLPEPGEFLRGDESVHGVRVEGVGEDLTEGPLVYDPAHPDADEAGYVRYPNVRITDELVELMNARRLYEANASVFQVAKAMLRRALEI